MKRAGDGEEKRVTAFPGEFRGAEEVDEAFPALDADHADDFPAVRFLPDDGGEGMRLPGEAGEREVGIGLDGRSGESLHAGDVTFVERADLLAEIAFQHAVAFCQACDDAVQGVGKSVVVVAKVDAGPWAGDEPPGKERKGKEAEVDVKIREEDDVRHASRLRVEGEDRPLQFLPAGEGDERVDVETGEERAVFFRREKAKRRMARGGFVRRGLIFRGGGIRVRTEGEHVGSGALERCNGLGEKHRVMSIPERIGDDGEWFHFPGMCAGMV